MWSVDVNSLGLARRSDRNAAAFTALLGGDQRSGESGEELVNQGAVTDPPLGYEGHVAVEQEHTVNVNTAALEECNVDRQQHALIHQAARPCPSHRNVPLTNSMRAASRAARD